MACRQTDRQQIYREKFIIFSFNWANSIQMMINDINIYIHTKYFAFELSKDCMHMHKSFINSLCNKKERAEKIDLFQLASILRQSTFINAWRMLNCFAGIMNTQLNQKINNHSRSYSFFSSLSVYEWSFLNGLFVFTCFVSSSLWILIEHTLSIRYVSIRCARSKFVVNVTVNL